jgi:predicted secreted hydrolase
MRVESPRLALWVGALLVLAGCAAEEEPTAQGSLSVVETMADADTAGYARAVAPRTFDFPADHGPHPDYRTEWWYFTGNLTDDDGRPFGFQLTFFRNALRPDPVELTSPWSTRQAYMGHLAVVDVSAETFDAHERFERGALGLAGAVGPKPGPVRVWIGDWEAMLLEEDPPTFRLLAADDGMAADDETGAGAGTALDLVVTATQPAVVQGEDGLSVKGPEPGNASYYYSLMRMSAAGTITVGGEPHAVSGEAWLDREWSTSALSPDLAGWDWFSLQLDDGSELMLYRLRTTTGGTGPYSAGTFVDPAGEITRLGVDDFVLEATGQWTSPRGGRYPSGWRVRVPGAGIELQVEPRLRDQELDLAFRYWEGAVVAEGRRDDRPVRGRGYVELTGYAE